MKIPRQIINILASLFVLGTGTMQAAQAAEIELDFSQPQAEVALIEPAAEPVKTEAIATLVEGIASTPATISPNNSTQLKALMRAIIGQESAGKFYLVNPHSGALGYGQVMPDNVRPWSRRALGKEVSPKEFLNSPDIQLQVIEHKLNEYLENALVATDGDEETAIRRVASQWYSGNPEWYNSTKPQYYKGHPYPSISSYGWQVVDRYREQLMLAETSENVNSDDRAPPSAEERDRFLDFSVPLPTTDTPPETPDSEFENEGDRAPSTPETEEDSILDFSVSQNSESAPEMVAFEGDRAPREIVSDRVFSKTESSLDFSVGGPLEPAKVETPRDAIAPLSTTTTKAPFAGEPVLTRGAVGDCYITDYRRYRSVHPVPGVPPRWHNGVDLACPGGTHAVYSPVAGKLTILPPERTNGGGLVARIQTDDGWTIQNMHMMAIEASPGRIEAGQKLGTGGAPKGHPNAGTGTGPHSHYERFQMVDGVRQYVDPTEMEVKALLGH